MAGLGYNYNLGSRVNSNPDKFRNKFVEESMYARVVDSLLDDTREWFNEGTKEKYPIGTIKCIRLNKDNLATGVTFYAYPSKIPTSYIPHKEEVVCLHHNPTSDLQFNVISQKIFYGDVINLWGSPTHNAMPANSFDGQELLGKGVIELSTINPLFPFPGDILTEGRQGQSIRIGGYKSPKNILVDDSNNGKPFILISNGQIKTNNGVDHIVEDINEDDNSIYFLSNHKAPLKEANSKRDSYNEVPLTGDQYKGNQLILNADRVFINAKHESVFLSSKQSIGLSSNTLNLDAVDYFCVDADTIFLGKKARTLPKGLSEPAVLGNELDTFLTIVLDMLKNIGQAMVEATAQTGGPIASLNVEGYCVLDTVTTLQSLLGEKAPMKSKKVFVE